MGGLTLRDVTIKRHPARPEHRAVVSVDLGKAHDYTAIAVLDRQVVPLDRWEWRKYGHQHQLSETHYRLRALRRLPLGVEYVTQMQMIADVVSRVSGYIDDVDVLFDSTGVGAAICDLADHVGMRPVRVGVGARAR